MTPRQIKALAAFVDAANELNAAWFEDDDGSLGDGYPEHMPSFDQFCHDVMAWRDAVEKRIAAARGDR